MAATLPDDPATPGPPNPGRLWAGGVATAVVAALVVIVGVLIARGVVHVPVLAPKRASAFGDASTTVWALLAACAAILATALLHLLLVIAPRPLSFFQWITGLATLAAVITPFTEVASTASQVTTALINLVTGIAVISLLSSVAQSAVRSAPRYRASRRTQVR